MRVSSGGGSSSLFRANGLPTTGIATGDPPLLESLMHYYQRNIGDYARDTGHLSVIEHGLYVLMLDWYYLNERPITDWDLNRICRGYLDECRMILSEYFKETEDGWVHSYADRVIEAYHEKAEKNRVNGQLGGRRKANAIPDGTQMVSESNPDRTLTNNQEPITKKIKSTVQRTAARFPAFWESYPNKKGKQEAEKRWRRDGLDAIADEIITHVRLMAEVDDGWKRGYVPMASTYLNQARWTDVPQAAPQKVNGHHIEIPQAKHKSKQEALAPTEDKRTAHLAWCRNQVERGMMTEAEFQAEKVKP